MRYALVLERDAEACNQTAGVVASMGYLVTPVFSPKKALHAAHMIQFDLLVTCTAGIPGDRRSLIAELARCSPDAIIILISESEAAAAKAAFEGVNAVVTRHVKVEDLRHAVDGAAGPPPQALQVPKTGERRKRAVD
jgi:CheY-like chemotaxis protein